MRTTHLVSVLLEGGLVLQVGPASREPPGLGVDVEGAVHPVLPVPDARGDVIALQWFQEGADQLLDGVHLCTGKQHSRGLWSPLSGQYSGPLVTR